MKLHELSPAPGSNKPVKRIGRGPASGQGKTAGKGMKGQGAHAHTKANGFEGGQTPVARRLPKFGVRKTHKGRKTNYAIVNLEKLNLFEEGKTVNAAALIEAGLIKEELDGVKILGNGKLTKKLVVEAKAFSASAKAAIESLGGEAKVL